MIEFIEIDPDEDEITPKVKINCPVYCHRMVPSSRICAQKYGYGKHRPIKCRYFKSLTYDYIKCKMFVSCSFKNIR